MAIHALNPNVVESGNVFMNLRYVLFSSRETTAHQSPSKQPRLQTDLALGMLIRILKQGMSAIVFSCALCILGVTGVLAETHQTRVTSTAEDQSIGLFSDLSLKHDGGVAHPNDSSTGNALQATLIDAYFWGLSHNGARVTVVASSEYPIYGNRILIPGNVDLICSSYSPQTYTGGCAASNTDAGNNTATGGSPLFVADFSYGVLADHRTRCSLFDTPQQAGCILIPSSGGSISGFSLFGGGSSAGGADVGIRVAADNFHVQDILTNGFFGGPEIQNVVGENDSYNWIFGTNVDMWWCQNPLQLTGANLQSGLDIGDGFVGALDLNMIDGLAMNNQISTGCSFSHGLTAGPEYAHMAALHISGAGNTVGINLAQVDDIALILIGEQHRVFQNRFEYTARSSILNYSSHTIFTGNAVTSPCIDHNLASIMPGAPNNGVPTYPTVPTSMQPASIIMDSNGNVEQDIYGNQAFGNGTTGAIAPEWPLAVGETVNESQIVWRNEGPWQTGLTPNTDSGQAPDMLDGSCYFVVDLGQNNTWIGTMPGINAGVDGPSYPHGTYFMPFVGIRTGNGCIADFPDAYGNGQCWRGGDLFANGGPPGLQPNGLDVGTSGGGTAYVGDYTVAILEDVTPQHYDNFQGMSSPEFFWVSSRSVTNTIDSWSLPGGGSVYGHPSLLTCNGLPQQVAPGQFLEFRYDETANPMISQVNCSAPVAPGSAALMPQSLSFTAEPIGVMSSPQTATLSNTGTSALPVSFSALGDFSETNNCELTLLPGAQCAISVSFTPTVLGNRSGAVLITDNVSTSPQIISLSGQGVVGAAPPLIPVLTTSSTKLTFPLQLTDTTSAPQLLTLTNSGSSPLLMLLSVTGNYTLRNTCEASLPVSASCTVAVQFTPVVAGFQNGLISIADNAAASPTTISLSGEGVSPGNPVPATVEGIGLSSSTSSMTTGASSPAVSAPFLVTSEGGFSASVSMECTVTYLGTGQPTSAPTCSVNPTEKVLNSDGNISGTLLVTTEGIAASVRDNRPMHLGRYLACLLAIFFLPRRRQLNSAFRTIVSMVILCTIAGCGVTYNSTQSAPATKGSYMVVVRANAMSQTASLTIPLNVH